MKGAIGFMLLSVLMLKFFAFSISILSSDANAYSIEKNTEENRDKEESFDTAKKKLLLYESSLTCDEHTVWSNYLPLRMPAHRIILGNFPPRNVPTPPPDYLS